MGALASIAAVALDGIRWVLLAIASGMVILGELLKDAAERLRR